MCFIQEGKSETSVFRSTDEVQGVWESLFFALLSKLVHTVDLYLSFKEIGLYNRVEKCNLFISQFLIVF
jgi:hypothetical protein